MRLGTARHKQRAAVGSSLGRDIERTDLLSACDDLLLVRTDQRTEHGDLHGLIDGHDVLERLGGNLTERFTSHDSLGALDVCNALGNRIHNAAIHDHAQVAGTGDRNLTLAVAKRHHVQAADLDTWLKRTDDVLHQILARIGRLRTTGEMYRHAHRAATREHPGRHRRIDTRGKQRHDLAGRTNRQTAHTALGARIHVDATLDHQHVHHSVRIVHLNLFIRKRLAQHLAHLTIDVNRGELIVGIGALGVHLKRIERAKLAQRLDGGGTVLLRVAVSVIRQRHTSNAGNGANDTRRFIGLMLVKGHEDITGNSRHGIHGKGGQGRLDVIHEDMLKMCAVLTLQSNLVIVDQADASRHLGFSNLVPERLLVTGLIVRDVAVDNLVHSHRDGIGTGKPDGDVIDILDGKHAVVLATQHAIDVAGALGGKRSEQEAVVIGLLQKIVNARLYNGHGPQILSCISRTRTSSSVARSRSSLTTTSS